MVESYDLEHSRVWPEMLAAIRAAGISDYSIFRRDTLLVLVMRVENFAAAWEQLDKDEVNRKWQQFMAPYFEEVPGKLPHERFAMMEEVFYLA